MTYLREGRPNHEVSLLTFKLAYFTRISLFFSLFDICSFMYSRAMVILLLSPTRLGAYANTKFPWMPISFKSFTLVTVGSNLALVNYDNRSYPMP